MNNSWDTKTWGEVLEVRSGRNQKEVLNPNGKYPILGSAGNVMAYADDYLCDEGTTIIGRKGTIDKPLYIETKFWNVDTVFGLVAGDKLDKRCLFYFCCSFNFKKLDKGTTLPSLVKKDLVKIEISFPPIEEQKQIVAILDQAFAAIDQAQANIQQNIQNAQDLFQSKLNQIFSQRGEGWEEKTLQEVSVEFGRGKSKHRPRNDPSLYDGDYPFIQTGDVRNSEHYITQFSSTYNEKGLQQSKLWPKGTVCITIAANIAETGILSFAGCFPDSIIGIVVNDKITTSNYVEFLLQAMKVRIQAKGKGSAQANINLGTFKKETFPFPSLIEQEKIMSELTSLSNTIIDLEKAYQQKINNLEELKKSLLQKAFSGELTQDKQAA